MYRYNVDNAVTYTPDDLVLFRESPFAVWMERLTLENPDHGILPDAHNTGSAGTEESQDSIVETLRAEGRVVVLIDREQGEAERRTATLATMRDGADFIVNGQLAVDVLSGSANLLMRTSGYSELGDFLYIPCETQAGDRFNSAFRLSFAADLLRSLQGQLPPQMLIIRDGADVVPLQTEDYIYYYWAVQKRFLQAMNTFRKHRMPDPVESAYFGRWSECAGEVLKQRALREQAQAEELEAEEDAEEAIEMPQLLVASGQTLAEQARMLSPGSFRLGAAPGHTPNLAQVPGVGMAASELKTPEIEHNRRSSDAALENLEFIGSSASQMTPEEATPAYPGKEANRAPAPNLREPPVRPDQAQHQEDNSGPVELFGQEPSAPLFLPPDPVPAVEPPAGRLEPRPADSEQQPRPAPDSVVDLDSAPAPSLAPETPVAIIDPGVKRQKPEGSRTDSAPVEEDQPDEANLDEDSLDEDSLPQRLFSNSLNTSQEFDD